MDCPDYLERFSEYADGYAGEDLRREMEDHRAVCPRCREYHRALREGTELLRSLPPLDVSPDFHARLDHRIFHIEDGATIARETLGSGATVVAILAVASLLTLAAWAPFLTAPPMVDLPAVVAVPPHAPAFTLPPPGPRFTRSLSAFSNAGFQEGIWGEAHSLLFQYSVLSERRRGFDPARSGVQ